jgi:hypothetical protein
MEEEGFYFWARAGQGEGDGKKLLLLPSNW